MPSVRTEFYIKLLKDPNPHVRQKAAKAIGDIGDKSCLFPLKDALAQEQEAVVIKAIREAIAKLEAWGDKHPQNVLRTNGR